MKHLRPATQNTPPALSAEPLLDAVRNGKPLSQDEALFLLRLTDEEDLYCFRQTAEELRVRQCGHTVKYYTGASLYLTNLCELQPTIYPYPKKPGEQGAYALSIDAIDATLELALSRKTNVIHISEGGFWSALSIPGLEKPNLLKTHFRLLAYLHGKAPEIALSGFSPDEIDFLSIVSDRSERYILEGLKDQGLQCLGGNGTAILNDTIRRKISPKKASVQRWLEIASDSAQVGLPVVCNLEVGHYESLEERVTHLLTLREFLSQRQSRFEKVFSRLELSLLAPNPLATTDWPGYKHIHHQDRFKLQALARLILGEAIPDQRLFRLPDSTSEIPEALRWGSNHLGSTDADSYNAFLLDSHLKQELTGAEMVKIIQESGLEPGLAPESAR